MFPRTGLITPEPRRVSRRLNGMRIRIPALVRWSALTSLVVGAVVLYSLHSGSGEVPRIENTPIRFDRAPDGVREMCREAQERADFVVLCPMRLPRQERGAAGCRPPLPVAAQLLRNGPRVFGVDVQGGLLHAGVIGSGGSDVMGPMKGWEDIGRRHLGGRTGRLYYSPVAGMSYHSGHLVFFFEVAGHPYAASLHAHGRWGPDDLQGLRRLVAALRPATRLTPPHHDPPGSLGSTVVGRPIPIHEVSDVALGSGRVWAVSYADSKVFPIRGGAARDPMPVPLNPLEGMLIHQGRLWVASSGADKVSVIDATSGVRLRTVDAGDGPEDLALVDGSMRVLNVLDATITPLDPATGESAGEPIRVPGHPVALDGGFGRLWVVDCRDGSLLAVDPDSGRVVSRHEIGRGANDVVAFAGSVWVSNWRSHSVVRIDPADVDVEAEIDAGDTPGELAGGRSGLWVADTRGTKILRVDPRTNSIVETVGVGEAPTGLAVGPRLVWVVDRHNLLRVRVGVLDD
jgi:YVTN family beta-propeller protein